MKRNTTKPQAEFEKPFGLETLPNATIAEESLLSACFQSIEDTLTATDFISEDDFYLEKHRRIFTAMKKVATSHNARKTGMLDYAELISAMTGTNIDNPALYLAGLVADVPLAVNIEHTAGIIKQKAILRQTIGIAYAGVRECMSCNGDAPAVIDRLQQNILSVGSIETSGNDAVHVGSLFESAIDRYEAASLTTGITVVTSGYPDIDHITSGFQPGDMVILAARPGMGKTALALNIAQNAAESGTPVSFFSLEMGKNQLMTRLIAGETGINSRRLESGRLSTGDWDTLTGINQSISSLPLYIDDTADLHFSGFRRKLRIAFKKQGVRFAVIDYIGLMKGEMSYGNRVEEVSSVSRAIKMTAKELNIPILVLSQLNRNLEARFDKHPMLSDLRESGALEQDADVVMLLYREEMYKKTDETRGTAELEIAKHRNGACGIARLAFDATVTTFKNLYRG